MKKISLIILMAVLGSISAMAQGLEGVSKSEYRYWNFVLGINHGFGGAMGGGSSEMMLHSDRGDLYQDKKGFTYTPGIQVGFVYNIDFLNNKTGVVVGAELVNYGFRNKYVSKETSYDVNVKETFRAMGVTVPIIFKFSSSDIYRDMSYVSLGVKPTINFMAWNGQKASWASEKFGQKLDGKKSLSCAATFGFNYNILSFNVNYMFMNFVDDGYVNGEGYKPFNGIKGHIFVCTSLNVPMTRWLSIHNWTAEKIRRKLHGSNNM